MGTRVNYSVRFAVDLGTVPDGVRQEIRRTMEQIAEAVATVPQASPFWISLKDSLLQIDVKDWRVVYAVDAAKKEIPVTELERLRR
jgi:hypothetical protein